MIETLVLKRKEKDHHIAFLPQIQAFHIHYVLVSLPSGFQPGNLSCSCTLYIRPQRSRSSRRRRIRFQSCKCEEWCKYEYSKRERKELAKFQVETKMEASLSQDYYQHNRDQQITQEIWKNKGN